MKLYEERGVRFAYTPLYECNEVASDPQVIANDYIIEADHPTMGKVKLVNFPIQFSKTPAQPRSAAPECGQHTEEVLLENGYTWEQIAELKSQELI